MKPNSFAGKPQQQPDGAVRQSQMVTTFGPGAMVDLLTDAVLVGGLDFWSYGGGVLHIPEPRLRDAIVERFQKLGRALSRDQPFRAPPVGNDGEPTKLAGVQVLEFPHWFVCQNASCRALLRNDGLELKGHRYWHQCDRTHKTECVPVRFVSACKRGHIDEFGWISFTHSGKERCSSPALTFEEGVTGDFNDIRVVCACGASAKLNATHGIELPCFGSRPWLGPEGKEECNEHVRLLVRTASNSYFPQVVSALSIPDPAGELEEKVKGVWDVLKAATKELLPAFRHVGKVRIALEGFSDEEVLHAVKAISDDKPVSQGAIRTAEFKQFVSSKSEAAGDLAPIGATFFARSVKPKNGLPHGVGRLVVASKLREVAAQIGFTRLEPVSPDLQGEYDLGVEATALSLTSDWLPASEMRGEGVFVELDETAVREWEDRALVKARGAELLAGYEAWTKSVEAPPPFPGVRFYMLHSLSHLLISAISLECGYAASAIRERIYCGPSAKDPTPMAAILLSTGTSGTEGTLGGLVEQGRQIRAHLQRAWDLGRLCSNDPVCGTHSPKGDHAERHLEGAACHGCLFIAECSCERFNRYLDRALVVPSIGHRAELAFFRSDHDRGVRIAEATMTSPLGLSRVPLPMLEQLVAAVERNRVECPLTESDLMDLGLRGATADVVAVVGGTDKLGALAALRAAIAERVHRPPPRLDLVWTGPETRASVARSTGLVVQELFESARKSVIVGGYTFDTPDILAPLHAVMKNLGVAVSLFVDIEGEAATPDGVDAFATLAIDRMLRKVWPFGLPRPDIYYDPRTAIRGDAPGHEWATLHAKCIVVDDERSLITSANFTDRGQTRNIEAGVLVEDRAFSEELAGHWRQLASEGLVRRYTG